eukprot:Seg4634.1 transcript_id=Seg4634.1/GoldUCD/mRNA.D3Y31 product="HMG domain-containing protein 3" protein_id=Seg4634.1/GoldUCD/D3Y31
MQLQKEMLLSKLIKERNIKMTEIDSMGRDQLVTIAKYCNMKTAAMSNDFIRSELHALYASIVVGTSACHGFTRTPGHTGGFYHLACRHGCTLASKFMMLTESVRDAADLYLSLRHPPITFVCDTACTFVRHMNNRVPAITEQLWGAYDGTFEIPDPEKKPSTVSRAR